MLRVSWRGRRDASVRAKCRELAGARGTPATSKSTSTSPTRSSTTMRGARRPPRRESTKRRSSTRGQLAIGYDKDAMRTLRRARDEERRNRVARGIVPSLGEDALPILLSLAPAATGHARRLSRGGVVGTKTTKRPRSTSRTKSRIHRHGKIVGDYFTRTRTRGQQCFPPRARAHRGKHEFRHVPAIRRAPTPARPGRAQGQSRGAAPVLRDAPCKRRRSRFRSSGSMSPPWSSHSEISEEKRRGGHRTR